MQHKLKYVNTYLRHKWGRVHWRFRFVSHPPHKIRDQGLLLHCDEWAQVNCCCESLVHLHNSGKCAIQACLRLFRATDFISCERNSILTSAMEYLKETYSDTVGRYYFFRAGMECNTLRKESPFSSITGGSGISSESEVNIWSKRKIVRRKIFPLRLFERKVVWMKNFC